MDGDLGLGIEVLTDVKLECVGLLTKALSLCLSLQVLIDNILPNNLARILKSVLLDHINLLTLLINLWFICILIIDPLRRYIWPRCDKFFKHFLQSENNVINFLMILLYLD